MKARLGFLLLLLAVPLAAQQPTPRELFERARLLDESNQNLPDAIALYAQVAVGAAAAGERGLAAAAHLRVGLLNERLGHTSEARRAFGVVVAEHADSGEILAQARARLSALAEPNPKSTGLTTRQVWADRTTDMLGSVSRDGRYLSFTDWETGDVAVRDLRTGVNRRVTNKGTWTQSAAFGEFSVISPDSRQIAYAWCEKEVCDLRVIARTGGQPRTLYQHEELAFLTPCDWSADGTRIGAIVSRRDGTNQIAVVSVADGSLRVLKTVNWGQAILKFSPDARYIAYESPQRTGAPERDLFVLAADGSEEHALVEHSANEFLLGWFPDGRQVLFASNRLGTYGVWSIDVVRGRPQGEPRLLKPDIGRVFGLGFTGSGDYYYGTPMDVFDVFIAELDPDGRKLTANPGPVIGHVEGGRQAAVWSPDGDQLAYLVQVPVLKGDASKILSIQTARTNAVRNITLPLNYATYVSWADGRSVVLRGTDLRGRDGLFRLDLATERIEPLVFDVDRFGAVAPDGRTLFYQRDSRPGVMRRDLVSGEEREVYSRPVSGIALSRDAEFLALRTSPPTADGVSSPDASIELVPSTGGAARTILTATAADNVRRALAWSSDGKHVLFLRSGEHPNELWRVSVAGGDPHRIATLPCDINCAPRLSVHPDNRRIAISAGCAKWEIWVMENLRPRAGPSASWRHR